MHANAQPLCTIPWLAALLPFCPCCSGVHECLRMTVAIPLLWGVPPEYDWLKSGIKNGGGIIDKVYREWHMH